MVHIYNGVLPCHKKSEVMPFAATWIELEIVILNFKAYKEKSMYDTAYMWNVKKKENDTNESIYRMEAGSQT